MVWRVDLTWSSLLKKNRTSFADIPSKMPYLVKLRNQMFGWSESEWAKTRNCVLRTFMHPPFLLSYNIHVLKWFEFGHSPKFSFSIHCQQWLLLLCYSIRHNSCLRSRVLFKPRELFVRRGVPPTIFPFLFPSVAPDTTYYLCYPNWLAKLVCYHVFRGSCLTQQS